MNLLTCLMFLTVPVSIRLIEAERFGILRDFNGGGRARTDTGESNEFSHIYDSRLWLGQPLSEVCRTLNSAGDLLLFAAESCITQRYVGTIQRPILFLPSDISLEGCWDPDAETLNNTTVVTNNSTENGLKNVSDNIIPLNIRGYKPAEIIPGLAGQGFHFENVLLVHVCDHDGYCGRQSMEQAVEQLHENGITTVQCWMNVENDTDFRGQFQACVESITFLSMIDRRMFIALHTRLVVIPSSIEILKEYNMLSVSAKVIYLVPPNYRVSDLDFLQIKDHDDVSLVRWQGEQWLASITQRPIDRYTKFWGSEFISSQEKLIPNLSGILATIATNQYYSRTVAANDPSGLMPSDICASPSDGVSVNQLKVIAADLLKTLSCAEKEGLDACSGYSVIKYEIDTADDTPRPQTFATWNSRNGYHRFALRSSDNFQGKKLRIAVLESPPFLQRNESAYVAFDGNDTTVLYEGVIPSILATLSGILNFKYVFVFPRAGDEYFGVKDSKTGRWNGLIGMMERNEVDMIASDLTISGERRELMDFTVPFYEDSVTVLLPRSQFDKSPFTFLFPFSSTVWFCVIAAVALSGPLLYFFSRASPYYRTEEKPNYFASLSESYMYCYGAIVSQGGQVTPDADSSRIFMAFWWLFGICTVATYSGNLIAFLTFPGKLKFVDNFDDFVYTSKIQPVIERSSYVENLLKESQIPSYQEAWKKIKENERVAVVELYQEAVDKVSRYKYGYIGSLANMQATIAHDSVVKGPCQYAFMRKPLEKVNYALAFKKGTNYPVIFDKWIRRMAYSGLIYHWTTEELNRSHRPKRCQDELENAPDQVRKVGIADVVGLYICLGAGCALACVVFLFEHMTRWSCCGFGTRLRDYFDRRDARHGHRSGTPRTMPQVTLNNGAVLNSQ